MNVLIIVAHPDTGSFNHAIVNACKERLLKNGHTVTFHDLYAEKFDPVLYKREMAKDAPLDDNIQCHCDDLQRSDGIIVIHPNWWGQPPAILTGWIDRIFRPGVAYRFDANDKGEGIPVGLLKARIGLVFNTANTSGEREGRVFKDPLDTIWRNCIFDLCGVKKFDRKIYRIMITSTEQERLAWLADAEETIDRYFPVAG